MPLCIKFAPANHNTLTGVINKEVKFSTVNELNDFKELNYIGSFSKSYEDVELFNNIVKKKLQSISFRYRLLNIIRNSGEYDKAYIDGFEQRLDNYIHDPKIFEEHPPILEGIAFLSVGIFCISHSDVFGDDSARLMFAHYGGNLKGVALVYEISNTTEIDYKESHDLIGISYGEHNRILRWAEEKYEANDMDDFITKTNKWSYEKEHRVFAKPGFCKAEDHGIKLKAILHTPKLNDCYLASLKAINKSMYGGELIIQEFDPSHGSHAFTVNGKLVNEWLKDVIGK